MTHFCLYERGDMSEEVDKHVLQKYEIGQLLGKGV